MRPAILLVLSAVLSLAACASTTPPTAVADPTLGLENARTSRRVAPNGDVIVEYRVAGQLVVVKVIPENAPTYFLIDSDRDGEPDNDAPMVHWKLFDWN